MSHRRRADSPTSSISGPPPPPPNVGQQSPTSMAGIFPGAHNIAVYGGHWTVADNVYGVPTNSPVPSPSRDPSGSSHVSSSVHLQGYEHISRANTSVTSLESNELSESDSERYSRILMSKGHGFPLWIPRPSSDWPLEYRQGGVSIGDVGFVTHDGIFDTFFNVTLPGDHPINSHNGVPEGFQPLQIGTSSSNIRIIDEHFGVGSYVASKSVFKYPAPPDNPTLYEFGCPQYKEGAILTLPFGACREDIREMKAWREYAHRHSLSWYRFVNEVLGREVPNGSIYLVTGCDKTICWGNATFPKAHRPRPFEMTFGLVEGSRGQACRFEWLNPGFAVPVSGTSLELDDNDEPAKNLCVFVRGFTASVRPGLWARLSGQVDVAPISAETVMESRQKGRFLPFSQGTSWWSGFWGSSSGSVHGGQVRRTQGLGPQQQDVTIQSVPPLSQPINPSSYINLGLFEQTEEGDIAVTHDSVWCSAIQQTEAINIWSPEFLSMLFATNKIEHDQDVIFLTAEKSPTVDQEQTYESSPSDIRLGSASNEPQDQPSSGFLRGMKVKNSSRKIDIQMAEEARKRPRCMQVLVLGQSDSGKGTLIKQCQRSIGPDAFQQEKVLWKLAIQLSAIRALRGTLELILQPSTAQTEAHDQPEPSVQSSANSLPGIAFSLFDPHSESSGRIETYSAGFPHEDEDEDDDDFSSDAVTSIFSHSSARSSLTSFTSEAAQDQESDVYILQLAEELLVRKLKREQAQVPQSLYGTISSGEINTTQSKHLGSDEAFSLVDVLEDIRERMVPHFERFVTENDPVADVISDQVAAVANLLDPSYMPSDGEVLHSKVPSRKTFEYQLQANGADGNPILWKFLSFRIPAKWSMIARDVDAIAFMIPVSTFNESSRDFPRLNRLEDAILGWRRLTSNRLIRGIGLVLVMNKVDILDKKLKNGVRFSDFVVTYGEKPNNATNVCDYLRRHLKQIHKASSTAGPFFVHLGSLVESTSEVATKLSEAVKTCVIRNNLQASHILI